MCGDKSKVVNYSDMYETSIDYNTYSQQVTGFDGEGQLTSAMNYVISEDMPILYTLEGHEEAAMSENMKETIQKANIEIQNLNLLTEEAVPEDAECLFVFAPAKDLTEDEANKIIEYLEQGGWLCFEIGYDQGEALKEMMTEAGYGQVKIIKDLAGRDRVAIGQKNNNWNAL